MTNHLYSQRLIRKTETMSGIYNGGNVIQGICYTGDMEQPRWQTGFGEVTQGLIRTGATPTWSWRNKGDRQCYWSLLWSGIRQSCSAKAGAMELLLLQKTPRQMLEEKYPSFFLFPTLQSLTGVCHWLTQESGKCSLLGHPCCDIEQAKDID